VGLEQRQRLRLDSVESALAIAPISAQEMVRQHGDITRSLPEGRERDRDDVDPIAVGARKRPPLVPEELRLQQGIGKGGIVHGNEDLRRARSSRNSPFRTWAAMSRLVADTSRTSTVRNFVPPTWRIRRSS
jgi:hypothetical protein